jgi:hypothetical protein
VRFGTRKVSGGSPEKGKGDRGKKRKRSSLAMSKFVGDARRYVELRREISSALRRFERGEGGEIERRSRATYRHGEESKRARIKGV